MEFKTNDNVTLHYSDTGEKDKPVSQESVVLVRCGAI